MSTEQRRFASAQWAWDNMAPPEDGPTLCYDCEGSGKDIEGDVCQSCEGSGYVDEDGSPYVAPEEA